MRNIVIITVIFFSIGCLGQNNQEHDEYKIISQSIGDLNKDGIAEKVIVYNTNDTTDSGIIREIQILKKNGNNWNFWKKSRNAILKSKEGGMMGDPFEEIQIKDGILLVHHSGGTSWKWNYTDKYRFQNNEFELIGNTQGYGKICVSWVNFDFNISTGKIIYKKQFEKCENENQRVYKSEDETFYKKGIRINLNNRNTVGIQIVSPKYKRNFSL